MTSLTENTSKTNGKTADPPSLSLLQAVGEYEDDKISVHFYDSYDGPSGVRVRLADGRLVYDANNWGGWNVAEFHPGRWLDYLPPIAARKLEERRQREEQEEAEKEAAKRAKFAPIDDSDIFGAEDPERWDGMA